MNYNFVPSLEYAATVSTVSLAFNDPEIITILRERRKEQPFEIPIPGYINVKSCELVEKKVAEKLFSLLPGTVHEKVKRVSRYMCEEVENWKFDHEFLLTSSGVFCFTCIPWNMNGTINRTEMAKLLVKDQSIQPELRFIVACIYFLEDEVLNLWKKIKNGRKRGWNRKRIYNKGTNTSVRFWMQWLQKGNGRPWKEMAVNYFRFPSDKPRDIHLRISSFFRYLPWNDQFRYIWLLKFMAVHNDDFIACLNEVEETEKRTAILKQESEESLSICIKLPFRPIFLEMAERVLSSLLPKSFEELLSELLWSYHYKGHSDFSIFEEFWKMIPVASKDELKNRGYLKSVMKKFLKSKRISESLKQIVRRCVFECDV